MKLILFVVLLGLLSAGSVAGPAIAGAATRDGLDGGIPPFSFRLGDGSTVSSSALHGKRVCMLFFRPESSIAVALLDRLLVRAETNPGSPRIVAVATVEGDSGEKGFRPLQARTASGTWIVRLGPGDSRAGLGADECCDSMIVYAADGRREFSCKLAEAGDQDVDRVFGTLDPLAERGSAAGRELVEIVATLPESVRLGGDRCAVVVGVFSEICPECEAASRLGYLDRLARREGARARVVAVLPASYSAIDLENMRAVYDYRLELVSADTSAFRGSGASGRLIAVFDRSGAARWIEEPGSTPRDVASAIEAALQSECAK